MEEDSQSSSSNVGGGLVALIILSGDQPRIATVRHRASKSFSGAVRDALSRAGRVAPFKTIYHRLAFPALHPRPAGPLRDETSRALLAATAALVGSDIDATRYEEFFRWRAETIPGHRALYEKFAATLNRQARRAGRRDFAESEQSLRLEVLRPAFRVRTAHNRLERLRIGMFHGSWVLFDLHIVRQIARLFARTDAWRLAGYESWPGTPRGLERYRMPLPGQSHDESSSP